MRVRFCAWHGVPVYGLPLDEGKQPIPRKRAKGHVHARHQRIHRTQGTQGRRSVLHRVFELHHGGRHAGNGEQHQHQHRRVGQTESGRGYRVPLSAEQPQTRPLPKRGGRQPLAIVPDRPGGIRLYCHDGGEGAPRESV